MRFACSVLLLGSLVGCGTHCPPIDDPIGPDFWGMSGGFCDGGCPNQHVYRNGAKVQLIVSDDDDACEIQGTLSAELVADIDELHAALLDGLQVGEPCSVADAPQIWLKFDESLTFAYPMTCAPEALAALDSRLAEAFLALGECRATADVQPEKRCKPAP